MKGCDSVRDSSRVILYGHTAFRAVILLLFSIIIGFIMMEAAFFLPTGNIKKNAEKAAPMFEQESPYFSVIPDISHALLDNATDDTYLRAAAINYLDGGIFTAMLGYVYPSYVWDETASLEHYGLRFWNGYEIIVKVLLLFTTYSGIRFLNVCVELSLLFWLLDLMRKSNLEKYRMPFLIMVLFLNPFAMTLCMTFAGYYYCMIIPCIIMCKHNDTLNKGCRYIFFFEAIGITVIYFNMNYIQLITFAIPLMFYFMINGFPQRIIELIKISGLYFCGWFFGYAGMMFAKWCVLDICSDVDIWHLIWENFMFRITANVKNQDVSRFDAISINFDTALGNPVFNMVEIVFILFCLYSFFKLDVRKHIREYRMDFTIICLLLFLVLMRYVILVNHVIIHHWVMYRLFTIPLFALNTMMARMAFPTARGRDDQ